MTLALLSSRGALGSRGQVSLSVLFVQCLPSNSLSAAQASVAKSAVTNVMRMVALPPVFHFETSLRGGSLGSSVAPMGDIGRIVKPPMIAAATKNLPPMTGVSSTGGGRRPLGLAFGLAGALGGGLPGGGLPGEGLLACALAGFSLSLMGRLNSAKLSR